MTLATVRGRAGLFALRSPCCTRFGARVGLGVPGLTKLLHQVFAGKERDGKP